MIPLTDMFIVLSKSYNGVLQALPHIIATIICSVFGIILLATKPQKKVQWKLQDMLNWKAFQNLAFNLTGFGLAVLPVHKIMWLHLYPFQNNANIKEMIERCMKSPYLTDDMAGFDKSKITNIQTRVMKSAELAADGKSAQ